jgi:hypothetical protein
MISDRSIELSLRTEFWSSPPFRCSPVLGMWGHDGKRVWQALPVELAL